MIKIKVIILLLFANQIIGQDTILPLWPNDNIPNHIESDAKEESFVYDEIQMYSNVQVPTLEIHIPAAKNATGEAMLIFPGGGYQILAYDWEGTDIAKFLNGKGIAGIVVKYRLPSSKSQKDKQNVPLIDAQRALRMVRSKASEFNIDTAKIGILGFSAGGHLAATLGTRFDDKVYEPVDQIDTLSARPNFLALGYPVITFGEMTHGGSRRNLIGDNPKPEMVAYFSNEKQVTKNTPPTFLFHASDDEVVPVENSLLFYKALKDANVSATMHIYPKGGHGFSLALKDPQLSGWTERMFEWLESLE